MEDEKIKCCKGINCKMPYDNGHSLECAFDDYLTFHGKAELSREEKASLFHAFEYGWASAINEKGKSYAGFHLFQVTDEEVWIGRDAVSVATKAVETYGDEIKDELWEPVEVFNEDELDKTVIIDKDGCGTTGVVTYRELLYMAVNTGVEVPGLVFSTYE